VRLLVRRRPLSSMRGLCTCRRFGRRRRNLGSRRRGLGTRRKSIGTRSSFGCGRGCRNGCGHKYTNGIAIGNHSTISLSQRTVKDLTIVAKFLYDIQCCGMCTVWKTTTGSPIRINGKVTDQGNVRVEHSIVSVSAPNEMSCLAIGCTSIHLVPWVGLNSLKVHVVYLTKTWWCPY
jgi:hypothetical protein